MSNPARTLVPATAQGPAPARPLPRWLFVAAAVGVIGVGIDLLQGPAAHAFQRTAAQRPALAAQPLDDTRLATLGDTFALEPGASVAAYDAPAEASEAVVQASFDGAAAEPGASVAAYER